MVESVFVTLSHHSGNVGICVYEPDRSPNALRIADYFDDTPNFYQLECLIKVYLSDDRNEEDEEAKSVNVLLLISSKMHKEKILELKTVLRDLNEQKDIVEGSTVGDFKTGENKSSCNLKILPSKDFVLDACVNRIRKLDCIKESDVNMSQTELVRALGAMVGYIFKHDLGTSISDFAPEIGTFPVTSVTWMNLSHLVHIDAVTYQCLNIFKNGNSDHPSKHNTNRDMSIYGYLQSFLSSSNSSRYLRKMMLMPTRDVSVLEDRLNAIELFSSNLSDPFLTAFGIGIKHIRSMGCVATRMSQCTLTLFKDLTFLSSSLKILLEIIQVFYESSHIYKYHETYPSCLSELLKSATLMQTVVEMTERVVEMGDVQKTGPRVKRGVTPDLLEKWVMWDDCEEQLLNIVSDIWESQQTEFTYLPSSDPSVVWLNNLGSYLIFPIDTLQLLEDTEVTSNDNSPQNNDSLNWSKLSAIISPNNSWTIEFEREGYAFFKTNELHRFDDHRFAIYEQIRVMESQILEALRQDVLTYKVELTALDKIIADMDIMTSMSKLSNLLQWQRPSIVANGDELIHIDRGRHPLVEIHTDCRRANESHSKQFIPNSTFIGESGEVGGARQDGGRIHIITGPNYSGKSVYIKQVGLIVYLTHIGMYVPAASAQISLCDIIFSKLESLQKSLSTEHSSFFMDLIQIAKCIKYATKKSLILFDEIGKGTYYISGVALSAAVISYFAKKQDKCPKILTTTHFREIFEISLLHSYPNLIRTYQMQIAQTNVSQRQCTFLYKLTDGACKMAYGISCAHNSGVDENVIRRAEEIYNFLSSHELQNKEDDNNNRQTGKCEPQKTTMKHKPNLTEEKNCGLGKKNMSAVQGLSTTENNFYRDIFLKFISTDFEDEASGSSSVSSLRDIVQGANLLPSLPATKRLRQITTADPE